MLFCFLKVKSCREVFIYSIIVARNSSSQSVIWSHYGNHTHLWLCTVGLPPCPPPPHLELRGLSLFSFSEMICWLVWRRCSKLFRTSKNKCLLPIETLTQCWRIIDHEPKIALYVKGAVVRVGCTGQGFDLSLWLSPLIIANCDCLSV